MNKQQNTDVHQKSSRSYRNKINGALLRPLIQCLPRQDAQERSHAIPFSAIEDEQYVPSKGWAEMIRRVYEVDPLICPLCGGKMRIIAFIEDHNALDRIIRHLKLTFAFERPPPPHIAHQELLMAAEERGEYF